MEHEQDETETSGTEKGEFREEKCPTCSGDPLKCDCIDDAAMKTYEKLQKRAKETLKGKRYKDVIPKGKFL